MKKTLFFAILLLALAGCADQMSFAEAAVHGQVGFWYGLWHGIILPFAWLISLFDSDVAIYAIYNNGGWYDFGFVLGATSFFGGFGGGSYKARKYRKYR